MNATNENPNIIIIGGAKPDCAPLGLLDPPDELRTESGLQKYVEHETVKQIIEAEISLHKNELKGKSGHVIEWEQGFIAGMYHIGKIMEKIRRTPPSAGEGSNSRS
jgi:hypothetical protein